jgi:flagella basal body P-ring formation protein FlgA
MFAKLRRTVLSLAGATAALAFAAGPLAAQEIAIVTQRVVYPGETIGLDMLREVPLKPGRTVPPAMVTSIVSIQGKVAKKTLLPGRYIPIASLREVYLVEQGAPVEVVFTNGSLTITAQAVSLQPGSEGDLIKVRNVDSGTVFLGTIMPDGSIKVGAS